MDVPDRDAVGPAYRIDPTRLYDSLDDWTAAHAETVTAFAEVEETQPPSTPDDLRALLDRVAACHERYARLVCYARVTRGIGDSDAPPENATETLDARREATLVAVRRTLDTTSESVLAALDERARYAATLRRVAVGSPDAETALAELSRTRSAPTATIRSVWQDYDPPVVEGPDGESVAVTPGRRTTALGHPDRAYRRRAYRAFWTELERFEETLATAYAAKLATARAEASLRGYDSPRDRSLHTTTYPETGLVPRLPESVHETMLAAVEANLDPLHAALARRRDRLGVDELRPWDLRVPTTQSPAIDYETATDHVRAALAPLGADYVARVDRLLDDRRIDVYPGDGKSEVGYTASAPDAGPFVRIAYRGDVASVFVLAHELGHAVHQTYLRDASTRYATAPRPTGELPATLHELLLADHLLDEGGAMAAVAGERLLGSLRRGFYRGTMIERFVHDLAERESIDADRIRETQRSIVDRFREPVVYDDAGRTWLGRGSGSLYDDYAYVLGATGALAVREQLRNGDPSAYHAFLRQTGRESPVEGFARLGCDVTRHAPFERAANAIAGYVDRV